MSLNTGNHRKPPMILLEWDAPTFSVARVTASGNGRFEVAQQFTITNADFSTQSSQEQASWLKQQLRSNGITQRVIHVVVPRRFVSTQLLSVPTREPSEISAICTLQLKGCSGSDQELAADYLTLPAGFASGEVAATPNSQNENGQDELPDNADCVTTTLLLASISREKLDSIFQVSRDAGLRVDGIHVAEFSLMSCSPETDANPEISLQVLRREKRIEFIVAALGIPMAAQTFPFLDDGVAVASVMPALGGRVLHGLGMTIAQQLSDVSLFGEGVEILREHFEDYFGFEIQSIPEQQSSKYPLLSLAQSIAQSKPVLDFANSRITDAEDAKPPIVWQPYAVAAALLLIGVLIFGNYRYHAKLSELTSQLHVLRTTNSSQQSQQDQIAYRELAGWVEQKPNWPKTLTQLSECFPGHDIAYLNSLHAEVSRRDGATIHASGIARSAYDVLQLQDELVKHSRWELSPRRVTTTQDDQYGAKFSLHVSSKRQP